MIFWRLNNKTISYYYKKVLMVLSFMCKLFDAYKVTRIYIDILIYSSLFTFHNIIYLNLSSIEVITKSSCLISFFLFNSSLSVRSIIAFCNILILVLTYISVVCTDS